jgi:hypothetical protein
MIPQTYVIDASIATKIGLEKALVLQRILDWCAYNQRNGRNIRQGRVWCYNTPKAWAAEMPTIGERKMRTLLRELVDEGLIIRGHFGGSDRTSWYSANDEAVEVIRSGGRATLEQAAAENSQSNRPSDKNCQIHLTKTVKSICQKLSDDHSLEQEKNNKKKTQGDCAHARGTTPGDDEAMKAVWEAYSLAYATRYGRRPERVKKDTESMATILGALEDTEAAVFVVALYVAHPRPVYLERCHELALAAEDVRKLRTELETRTLRTRKGERFARHVYGAVVEWWEARHSETRVTKP